MAIFPLHKIRALAENRQAYLRGVSGYNTGWVTGVTVTDNLTYPTYITADLSEHDTRYRVELGFDHRGGVGGMACTCMRMRPGAGACKHVVAVLVHKYYTDMLQESPAPGAANPAAPVTDPAARQLIDRYLTAESRRLTARAAEQPATLEPILSLEGACPGVAFRVGAGRPYQVKNLSRFAHRFTQGETAEYGKDLCLLHHRDSFEQASQPLLDFLLTEIAERETALGGQPYVGGVGELMLTPAGFDRLYTLLAGREVLLQTGDGQRPVRLKDGAPTLAVTVEAAGEGLRLWPEAVCAVFGAMGLYVLQGDTLYRTSAAYSRRMTPWLQVAGRAAQGLYMAPAEATAFCAGVLPAIRTYVELQGEPEVLDAFAPLPLNARVWLDNGQEGVVARVRFGARDPYAPTAIEAPRQDPLAELEVKLAVERYFLPTPTPRGSLPFAGDEARLFEFVTTGLKTLRRVATVDTTPAFEALLPTAPPPLRLGVSLVDDLLQVDIDMEGFDPTQLSGIIAGYREGRSYHRLRDGRFLPLEEGALSQLAELTQGLGLSARDLQKGQLTLPKYRALYLDALLSRRPADTVTRDLLFHRLVERVEKATEKTWTIPPSLESVLRDYQKEGFRWLRTMEEVGFGGILADDMGLGKTLQVLALLLAAKEEGSTHAPSLVVCPTSVVLGWEQEAAHFAPALSVLCVIGDAATRRQLLERAEDYDLVVTSYDMLKRDVAAYEPLTFRYHILDEAQYIKNSATQNARAAKCIHSAQRFALTGTPVENRLSELWSIFDFLMPGLLFSQQKFRARFEQPLMKGEDPRVPERLGELVGPFILRRLKKEVLTQLPEKTERVLPANMERVQRQVYLDTLASLRQQLTGVGDRRLYGKNRIAVLAQLTRLRQICCDPRLCCEGYTGGSGKLEACMELLREAVAGGHKVLLFSQFTSMLALLKDRLEEEGIAYYLLQGSTSKEQRAAMVKAFNGDRTPVFLISLKAGGTGLNLTGADMVIHYDPWWNLAAQNQATDRAHRIGQKNPVQVVRLVARDSIEDNILRMQEEKWRLATSVVEGDGPPITAMTAHELLRLLDGIN